MDKKAATAIEKANAKHIEKEKVQRREESEKRKAFELERENT